MSRPMNSPEAPWRDLADRYSVQRKIGQGGMATVYLARDLRHDRDVALKVLKPEVASVMGVDRFLSEIAVVSRLNHPHIVPLFDSGETDGSLFYVMPYLPEPSLRDLLKREGQLPIDEAMHLVGGIAAALSHAHEQGILHRDIKPENVMISGGEALVTDFGIALALSEAGGERLTETGMSVGTAEYMSPEQAMGEGRLDERSDVYALATVVYEMLAGEPPFRGMNAQAVLARRLTESPRPLRTVRDRVPVEMEQAVLRALARSPADRPRTVEAFVDELETGWKTGTIAPVGASDARAERGARWGRRWTVALLVLIAAVLGAELWRASTGDPGLPEAADEIDPDLVAVLPFAFSGGPDEDFLGDGVMTLLSGALNGAGQLTTVDTRAVQSRVEGLDGRSGDDVDRSLAASFGAGRFVSGTIADLGGSVRIQARLAAVDESAPAITATAEGPPGEVSGLAEQIAVELITGLSGGGPSVNPSQVRVQLATGAGGSASVLSDSLEALKAYLQGAEAIREGRYNEAIPRFQRAVSVDPAFALAWHRLSTSAWAARLNDVAEAAGDSASAMIDRLSPRHAELVRAFTAYRAGRADAAEQGYREVVRRFPSEVEAWYMVGETQYHLGPLTGSPTPEAIPAFEETLLLEPGHRSAMGHLAGIGVEIGDLEMADTLSAKYLELHPDADLAVWMEMIRATALGDTTVRASIHERLDAEPGDADRVEPLDMMFAAAFYRDFAWADSLAAQAADPSRDVMQRLSGLGYRAYVLTTLGRPAEAMRVLDLIDQAVPGLPLKVLFEAHLATLRTSRPIPRAYAASGGRSRRCPPRRRTSSGSGSTPAAGWPSRWTTSPPPGRWRTAWTRSTSGIRRNATSSKRGSYGRAPSSPRPARARSRERSARKRSRCSSRTGTGSRR